MYLRKKLLLFTIIHYFINGNIRIRNLENFLFIYKYMRFLLKKNYDKTNET